MKAGFESDPEVKVLPGEYKDAPYQLARDFVYHSAIANRSITVPEGYRTDFLSIPWLFRRVLPKGGQGRRASIVHDWLCDQRPEWSTGKLAAKIFLEAMEVDGVPKWKRHVMYRAVRWFGPQWREG